MQVTLVVTVEPKDEYAGGDGILPLPGDVAAGLRDDILHETKDNFDLPWRVIDVQEL